MSQSESYLFLIIDRFLTGKINRSEAAIRTNLNGDTKYYVMENEVTATEIKDIEVNLEPIKKRKRFKTLCNE